MQQSFGKDFVIDQLSEVTTLDPDIISAGLAEVEQEYGADEVAEALEELSERPIPTGEGLTRKEAKKLLVEEMNAHTQRGNVRRMQEYRVMNSAWFKGELKGPQPTDPIILKGYTMKRLDQAVFKARQTGLYRDLLKVAGY
jgi:hypothetical protein